MHSASWQPRVNEAAWYLLFRYLLNRSLTLQEVHQVSWRCRIGLCVNKDKEERTRGVLKVPVWYISGIVSTVMTVTRVVLQESPGSHTECSAVSCTLPPGRSSEGGADTSPPAAPWPPVWWWACTPPSDSRAPWHTPSSAPADTGDGAGPSSWTSWRSYSASHQHTGTGGTPGWRRLSPCLLCSSWLSLSGSPGSPPLSLGTR